MPQSIAHVLATFPLPGESFITEEILSLFKQNIQPSVFHVNESSYSKVHSSALSNQWKVASFTTSLSTAANYDHIPYYGKTNENSTCLPFVLSVHWRQSNSCSAAF